MHGSKLDSKLPWVTCECAQQQDIEVRNMLTPFSETSMYDVHGEKTGTPNAPPSAGRPRPPDSESYGGGPVCVVPEVPLHQFSREAVCI